MRISIELVPKTHEHILNEVKFLRQSYPQVDTINFPDLIRLDIRSWEACKIARNYYKHTISHVRAIDFDLNNFDKLKMLLEMFEIKEMLVVSGDMPQNMQKIYPTSSVELIKKIKNSIKNIKVYASIDPYRQSIRSEKEYIKKKIDAGADGFFTQPFFDCRLIEFFYELLNLPTNKDVFWGISPVLSKHCAAYWEAKNNVVFPKNFSFTMDSNILIAQNIINFAISSNTNVYFMPIKIDLQTYFSRVFKV